MTKYIYTVSEHLGIKYNEHRVTKVLKAFKKKEQAEEYIRELTKQDIEYIPTFFKSEYRIEEVELFE